MFKSLLGNFKEYFKSVLSEDYGSYSFMRFISVVTLTIILSTWAWKNMRTEGFVDFGPNSVLVVLAIVGGKVAQKFVEDSRAVREKEIDSDSVYDASSSDVDAEALEKPTSTKVVKKRKVKKYA